MNKSNSKLFEPNVYFQNRKGLNIWGNFVNEVLPHFMKPIPYRGLEGIIFHDLANDHSDSEIFDKYFGGEIHAQNCAFTLDQIAELIEESSKNKIRLKKDGNVNIFYLHSPNFLYEVIGVGVVWRHAEMQWDVAMWLLNGLGNSKGDRVFQNSKLAEQTLIQPDREMRK